MGRVGAQPPGWGASGCCAITPTRAFGATSPIKGEVRRVTAARQHCIDQIMPRALIAEIDFQAVVKEGKEVGENILRSEQFYWTLD